MRLLLTRPAESADDLSARLARLGHSVWNEPLLKIEPLAVPAISPAGLQAIVATSANALRNIPAGPPFKALPLYAVGEATADVATKLGFEQVIAGPGTARDLAAILRRRLKPDLGTILYLRGEEVAFDLQAALMAENFAVLPVVCYRAIATDSLSVGLVAALAADEIDAAVLMSPRTAEVYVNLARSAGVLERLKSLRHFCLSRRIAAPLEAAGLNEIHVPLHPTGEELVALIGTNDTHSPPSA